MTKYNFSIVVGGADTWNDFHGLTFKVAILCYIMIQVLLSNFKEDQFKEKIKFKELTMCFRINVETFRRLNVYASILHGLDGAGYENGTEVD